MNNESTETHGILATLVGIVLYPLFLTLRIIARILRWTVVLLVAIAIFALAGGIVCLALELGEQLIEMKKDDNPISEIIFVAALFGSLGVLTYVAEKIKTSIFPATISILKDAKAALRSPPRRIRMYKGWFPSLYIGKSWRGTWSLLRETWKSFKKLLKSGIKLIVGVVIVSFLGGIAYIPVKQFLEWQKTTERCQKKTKMRLDQVYQRQGVTIENQRAIIRNQQRIKRELGIGD